MSIYNFKKTIFLILLTFIVIGMFGLIKRYRLFPKDYSATQANNSDADRKQYKNDIDRLNSLMMLVNKAGGYNYIGVFGNEPKVEHFSVNVDYSLFERLSDSGVGVMITQAILSNIETSDSTNVEQTRISLATIMSMDEKLGRIIAISNLSSDGFEEWLEQRSAVDPDVSVVDISQRKDAFMKGYLSFKK